MRTVASAQDLQRYAIERGATASLGGKQINAQGTQLKVVAPRPAPAPEPAPMPAAPPALDPLAMAVDRMGSMLSEAISKLQVPAEPMARMAPVEPPAAPPSWDFEVLRDKQGLMTQVTATASSGKTLQFQVLRDSDALITHITTSKA